MDRGLWTVDAVGYLAVFGIGLQELLVILLICLLLFGAQRLPEIGRSLGKAIQEFKKAGRDDDQSKPPESKRNDP